MASCQAAPQKLRRLKELPLSQPRLRPYRAATTAGGSSTSLKILQLHCSSQPASRLQSSLAVQASSLACSKFRAAAEPLFPGLQSWVLR